MLDTWLQIQRCDTNLCEETHLVKIVKLDKFWSQHSTSLNIGCSEWGVAGVYRVVLGVERNTERNMSWEDTRITTSRVFYVDWSTDYSINLNRDYLESCPDGKNNNKIFLSVT